MPSTQITFSVVIPTHKRHYLLPRAVTSVLRQDFGDFEVIVVDDNGSSYGECGIRDRLELPADPRIRVVTNDGQRGAGPARNVGIAHARGRYIAFLDDDDEYLPGFLSSTFACLAGSGEEIGLCCSGVKYLDYQRAEDGQIQTRETLRPLFDSRSTNGIGVGAFLSIGMGFGITFKAECLKTIGQFDEKLRVTEDTDLFYRFVAAGYRATVLKDIRVVVHRHLENRLSSVHMNKRRIEESRWLLQVHRTLFKDYPDVEADFLSYLGRLELMDKVRQG